jgi:hypothetical protein
VAARGAARPFGAGVGFDVAIAATPDGGAVLVVDGADGVDGVDGVDAVVGVGGVVGPASVAGDWSTGPGSPLHAAVTSAAPRTNAAARLRRALTRAPAS